MPVTTLMPLPKQQFLSQLGLPLVGGKVYTYAAGTNNLKTTYTDAAGTVAQANPIPLNVRGEPASPIYWSGSYKVEVRDALGNVVYTVDNFNTDPAGLWGMLTQLAGSAGASLVGFIAAGAGAVARTLQDRGRDRVSVFDYMTQAQIANVRAGVVTDVTTEAQRAINSITNFGGTVEFPPGNIRISSPLVTSIRGLVLKGASKYGTYITAADGAAFDMLRIAHQQVEVSGFIFRPASADQVPIRVYAGRAHIHDNYMLAAVNNSGIGILLTDIDPVSGAFVAGAYAHTIDNNTIGDGGFAFANGITESSSIGITATRFRENNILSNRPIKINKGGANVYRDNLLQSSGMGPTGVGITLGPSTAGEKISGNYFEGFQAQIETQNTDATYQLFHAIANHNDNCTAAVADAGAKNYVIEDPVGKVENRNGWSTRYTSTSWGVNAVGGISTFGADSSGNCFLGASSGASHVINRPGSTESTVILNLQGAGISMGYLQDARGGTINGANTALALNKNTTTLRSINTAGTVNTSGADYAEYMRKTAGCGAVAKGQIIGINGHDEITDRWADAVTFAIKSTDPSYVGGDTWFNQPRPETPDFGSSNEEHAVYVQAVDAWEAAHEAARQQVDRIAFSGRVPVNVLGAAPGQFIVPAQDGLGIKGIAVTAPTFEQYTRAVGKVVGLESDGRARVIVKSA